MIQRILIAGLFCFWTLSSQAQIPRDEILKLEDRLRSASSDSARFNRNMDLSQAYRFSNIDSALYYAGRALQLGRDTKNSKEEADGLSQLGFIVLISGDIPKSLQYQLEALRLVSEFSSPETEGFILNRIGNVYAEISEFPKAIAYYQMAIDKFRKGHFEGYVQNEYSNIGDVYEMMDRLDSSKLYQQRVYDYSLKNTDRYAITYGEMRVRLGNIETRLGNYDAALDHYRNGIEESLKDVDYSNLALNYLQLAKLYNILQHHDSSYVYARETLATANSLSYRHAIYEADTLLIGFFKLRNLPDSALVYSELSSAMKDSLYGKKKVQELQRILLAEQEHQQQLQQDRRRQTERYRLGALLGALFVFLGVGILLYRNNRQKQKANKKLEATLIDLKSTQKQLIQSEKMASLGELTAGIAHEIQNPLNFINNFSELNSELMDEMQQEIDKGNLAEAKEIAHDIKENEQKINHHGKRADGIVKGMLQHSRTSSGQKEPTDINALVDEYLRLAYHGLRAKDNSFNAAMKTDFDEKIGKINIVPQDIGRVILNLITNAFYAVGERASAGSASVASPVTTTGLASNPYNPTVSVSSRKIGNRVEIRVADNGNGIPASIKDKIFQPFFTTKPTGQGTGLGLSLSYDIVKAHGGELNVETKEGGGTTFIIQLQA